MFKYVDICVDMKQGRKCKDALINYRNACQQVNVGSLEEVIKYLLQVASQRAEEASKAAEAKLDVEDLEAEASPEEMMLSYVSGEKSKDRTDREMVTPWFKFLWETYRCARRWAGCVCGGGGEGRRRAEGFAGAATELPTRRQPQLAAGSGVGGTACSTIHAPDALHPSPHPPPPGAPAPACRNVLDILRNNSRLEALYAMATSRACAFCLTYKRTTEFRRLCDIVRNHLSNLIKYRDQGGRDRTDIK